MSATQQAALRKERQHRRALYDEVRRLTPKTWRPEKPRSDKALLSLTDLVCL